MRQTHLKVLDAEVTLANVDLEGSEDQNHGWQHLLILQISYK